MKTLLLIDGNAIMYRAFFAIPATFKTKDGTPTNAVYGFLTMLQKAIYDFKPEHVIICFDTPVPTFRKKLFEKYQSHRVKIADEFRVQIPVIKEMIDVAGIARIEKGGFEADDIIGTLTKKYKKNHTVIILTGDKDIMQLVDKNVCVMSPQTGLSSIKLYDVDGVMNKLGVTPPEIPDLKGLMGDPSDNYPGAKGIGPKTAVDLLKQFGTVEKLLKNIDKIENPRIRTLIESHKDNILLSKKLATIMCDVPIKVNIETARFEKFNDNLKTFLLSLQMDALATRLFDFKREEKPKKEVKEMKKETDDTVQEDLFS